MITKRIRCIWCKGTGKDKDECECCNRKSIIDCEMCDGKGWYEAIKCYYCKINDAQGEYQSAINMGEPKDGIHLCDDCHSKCDCVYDWDKKQNGSIIKKKGKKCQLHNFSKVSKHD